jgi:hypothetical protein
LFYPQTKWLLESAAEVLDHLTRKGIDTHPEPFPIQVTGEQGSDLARKSNTEWNLVIVTNPGFHQGQMRLIEDLVSKKKKVAVIGGAFPFSEFPAEVKHIIAAYWTWPYAIKAALRGLMGERKMKGVLPFR